MTEKLQVYRCKVCGNIVTVLHTGVGTLVCCKEPMLLCAENTVDAAVEKHVPVLQKTPNGFTVKVGKIPHPMQTEHYIEWVELIAEGKSYHQFLVPGCPAEAVFCVKAEQVTARAYCNLHGLWKS